MEPKEMSLRQYRAEKMKFKQEKNQINDIKTTKK